MLTIYNIRLGHATNSSSSHSMVFLPNAKKDYADDMISDNGDFGWETFTAVSDEAKRKYLGAQFYSALKTQLNDENAIIIANDLAGTQIGTDSYVDHQSIWSLPMSYDRNGINVQFAQEVVKYVLGHDDLVFLGGNDNGDCHELCTISNPTDIQFDREECGAICRYDAKGDYWSIFNRTTGAKIRMSFSDPKTVPTKAFAPELVDVKITDKCDRGCAYCYQGSTSTGKHADQKDLYSIAYLLGQMQVFECAIGGGEPTDHPDFIEFCEDLRSYGVVPNFTTKKLDWLSNSTKWNRLKKVIGGFAYSVESAADVHRLGKLYNKLRLTGHYGVPSFAVQYVMGSKPLRTMTAILKAANEYNGMRVTLLGFKTTGRGAIFKPHKYDGWIDIVSAMQKKYALPRLSIDTAIAAQYEKELLAKGVHAKYFHTQEGKFSMYIDAVSNKVGASSYVDPLALKSINGFWEREILAHFEKF